MALVLVLWVITLLSVVAASFSLGVRRDAGIAQSLIQTSIVQAAAEAGIRIAMLGLHHPDPEQRWEVGDAERSLKWNGVTLRIAVSVESGRIDINYADEALLDGLLDAVGVDAPETRASIVAQILDWRDPSPGFRPNGLSAEQYQRLGYDYGPANTRFHATEELLLLPGIGMDLYRSLEPLVTVHSGRSQVNPAAADYQVLLALPGINAELAEGWLVQREEARGQGFAPPPLAASGLAGAGDAVHTVQSVATLPSGTKAAVRVVMQRSDPRDPEPFRLIHFRPTQ